MNGKANMIDRRRFFELLIAMGVAATGSTLLNGCTQPAGSTSNGPGASSSSEEASNIVIDAKGNQFTIPESVDRIAITCNGGATHEVAIFGGADKIVAQPSMKRFPQLLKMYPVFNDVIDAGSFDDLNIEALVARKPDVALVGVSSEKGNAQIADVGIPTYVMLIGWAAIDTLKQEFLNVGKILGNEAKAQELVERWNETFAELDKRAAGIPTSARKKVYYLSAADITKANKKSSWGRTWVNAIGADFAVPESEIEGDVTIEKVFEWDPDVIVVQGGNDIEALYANDQIKDLKAIRNRQVYSCPIAGFWWDRPSPEAILGFMWLAQTVYPEQMGDIDLKEEAKGFYRQFYGYELSDEEYLSFF